MKTILTGAFEPTYPQKCARESSIHEPPFNQHASLCWLLCSRMGRGHINYITGEGKLMLNHWMGRAAMIVALPALLAGSLAAPAYAYGGGGGGGGHGGGDDDGDGRGGGRDRTVHVTVCKEVRGGDRWDDRGRGRDRDRDRDRDFNIRLRTTEDR